VVQQVQGESQDKQLVVEPSTPYPGSTSALGNMGTLYPGNTTTPGNPTNIASTSTLHPSNTLGNAICVNASSPYPGGVLMGNSGSFTIANLSCLGARPVWVTRDFLFTPHQPTQTQTFSNRITKPWLTVLTYGVPDIFFPGTPAYNTPNSRVEGEVNDGVRDEISRTVMEFRFTPKGQARSYQKSYPEYIDMIPYPRGFRVPDLAKFMGDDAKTMYEHIG
jgi:hypothetical protein